MAFTNTVPMFPVAYDDDNDTPEHALTVQSVGGRWSEEDFADCQRNGISLGIWGQPYVHLQRLPKLHCERVAACMGCDPGAPTKAIDSAAATCRNKPPAVMHQSHEEHISRQAAGVRGPTDLQVAAVANSLDGQAISGAAFLGRWMAKQTRLQTIELLSASEGSPGDSSG